MEIQQKIKMQIKILIFLEMNLIVNFRAVKKYFQLSTPTLFSHQQTDTSQLNSPPTQRTPLAPCSSNVAPPSTRRNSLVLLSSHISLPRRAETKSKRKRGPGKRRITPSVLIDSGSKNERSSRRRCPYSNLSTAKALVQTKAMDKAIHE